MQSAFARKLRNARGKAHTERPLLPAPDGELRVPAQAAHEHSNVRLSVIVPTYNESKNITEIVRALTLLLDEPLGGAFEIIVVDDDSPDRTWEIAQKLTAQVPCLSVIRRRGERGLSTAVIRGFGAAKGDILAVIDADLQHPPEVMCELWRKMETGVDLVVASRHTEGGGVSDWPLHRRILSAGAKLIGLALLPGAASRVTDPMSGCFMVRRSAIAGTLLRPIGYKILLEIIGRCDIGTISEVGYVFGERAEGESKVTFRLYLEYIAHLARLRVDTLPLGRFLRFSAVGLGGVVVDMGVLYLLSDPTTLGIGLTRSKVAGATLAIVHNFLWNDAWTFRSAAARLQGPLAKVGRFVRFALVCTAGLLLNVVLLNLLFHLFGLNRYLANAIAISLVTLWNFTMTSRLYRLRERIC